MIVMGMSSIFEGFLKHMQTHLEDECVFHLGNRQGGLLKMIEKIPLILLSGF